MCVIGGMKSLSHIMVSLSVILLLFFGAGGMGSQRCSCSGRVSMLHLAGGGCCNRDSGCMDVKVSPVSVADNDCANVFMCDCVSNACTITHSWFSQFDNVIVPSGVAFGWQCRGSKSPPGWLAGNCAVLRV